MASPNFAKAGSIPKDSDSVSSGSSLSSPPTPPESQGSPKATIAQSDKASQADNVDDSPKGGGQLEEEEEAGPERPRVAQQTSGSKSTEKPPRMLAELYSTLGGYWTRTSGTRSTMTSLNSQRDSPAVTGHAGARTSGKHGDEVGQSRERTASEEADWSDGDDRKKDPSYRGRGAGRRGGRK